MKRLSKITSLVLALMMVLSMSVAWADGGENDSGSTTKQYTNGTFGTSTAPGSSIGTLGTEESREKYTAGITTTTFNVHFDVKDENASRPKTQFSYTIANGTAVAATETNPAIKAGITGGATLPTSAVTDAWDTVNATADTDTITITFDASKFSETGIYRYKITEAALTSEQTAIGIVDGNTATTPAHSANELYLDVYVSRIPSGGDATTLAVTGAVLFDTLEQPILSDTEVDGTKNLATYNHKVDGFYNSYTSYSLTLQKKVTGQAGDLTESFPFKLLLMYTEPTSDNDEKTTILGQTVTLTADTNGKATVGSTYAIGSNSGQGNEYSDITMKDGGKITITGLSKTAVVKLMETVSAGEGYLISSVVTGMEASAQVETSAKKYTESEYITVGTVKDASDADITYTNNREAISPTGYIARFAPYALILVAGIALLVVALKKRKTTDEE